MITDFNFLGNVNSIYALVGVLLFILFQMWLKYREDKKYREERTESDKAYREQKEKMHAENMRAQNELIKGLHENLNLNNEFTHKNIEHIIDIAETIDKKHKTKKAAKYSKAYTEISTKTINANKNK